jgi:hypothetical protein
VQTAPVQLDRTGSSRAELCEILAEQIDLINRFRFQERAYSSNIYEQNSDARAEQSTEPPRQRVLARDRAIPENDRQRGEHFFRNAGDQKNCYQP